MKRESRKPNRYKSASISDKIIIYSSIAVAILSAILIGLIFYSRHLAKMEEQAMDLQQMAEIAEANRTSEESKSASSEIGKSVEESKNETNTTNSTNTVTGNTTNTTKTTSNTTSTNKSNSNALTTSISSTNTSDKSNNTTETTNKPVEAKKELSFAMPVDGEVMNGYAKDNLIYSNTLEEWVTHLGIDIKAEKTTVVKASEGGKIKSIKSDPRYGLTIVIDHNDGFQTIYSNLLTTEFVVEGEEVEKGQTIGTVGNTAAFESADESHLHFEILKDSIQVDPNMYLK